MLRLLFALSLLIFTTPAFAQDVKLTAEQMELAEKLRTYLNGMQTLKGSFAQISSNGDYADGKVVLSRPGKMRLTYNPPLKSEIVVRKGTIIYHDKEFKQVTYYPLSATPLEVLLQDKLSFEDDVRIVDLAEAPGVIELMLVDRDDPGMGSVTLVFSTAPIELRKWTVVDAQGIMTQVSLLNARSGVEVDPKTFDFIDPKYNQIDN
ncbi:outer membrane lipoprotein carrier protein LolA [Terasakiella sp. A23]|uniref:LolA family protein n=1 Tax=Terasakiella sp. FCG-A23 TaxID=3080561 RepID=UPI0029540A35|nr:outer membrane lipoprotein carrier protein LolA [Terasakiella sp. A23]MDV7341168.1 outer membrane lipoprotein carrier protein LolA [Terasakiella sp. A23]